MRRWYGSLARVMVQPARSCSTVTEMMHTGWHIGCLGTSRTPLDVVQEAMLKAFSALKDFDGRSGFRTWLLRIVTNAAYDWGRRRKRRREFRVGDDESDGHEPAIEDDPARPLRQQDLRLALEQALNRLSPTIRTHSSYLPSWTSVTRKSPRSKTSRSAP